MVKNIVGKNLEIIRRKLAITQEELAFRSGLTQGYINFLENGRRGYSERSLEKIANALGVQISALFKEKSKKETNIVAEKSQPCRKRGILYEEMICLLDKLPISVVDHYKILLKSEVEIRSKGFGN